MAFLDFGPIPGSTGELDFDDNSYIYNVSYAVGPGPGATNSREDVKLVQTLLIACDGVIFATTGVVFHVSNDLATDGKFSPVLQKHILAFQQIAGGGRLSTDSRIDRAHGLFGSLSGKEYTIHELNRGARFRHPNYYPPLGGDGDPYIPHVLKLIKLRDENQDVSAVPPPALNLP